MRVLLANYRYFLSSGSERYMFNVTEQLEKRRHEVIPFAVRYAKDQETPYAQYFVPPLGTADEVYFRDHRTKARAVLRTVRRLFYDREVERAVGRLARDTRPDVAYVLNYLRKLSPALLVGLHDAGVPIVVRLSDFGMVCPQGHCLRAGAPCVLCTNGDLRSSIRHRCVQGSFGASALNAVATRFHHRKRYFDLVAAFVVPSPFMHRFLTSAGMAPERLHLIPSFVDSTRFRPSTNGDRAGYIAYAGRIDPPKGLEVLIDAIAILARKRPAWPIDVRIAGSGSATYVRSLEARIATAGLQNAVRFVGELAGDALVEFQRRARVAVIPSLWFENLPNSLLESLACGTPVVASNVGSLADCIDDGSTGFLFERGNAASLAARLEQLLDEPGNLVAISTRARAIAERDYSPSAHLDKLQQLFEGLVQQKAERRRDGLRVAYLGSKGLGVAGGVERVVGELAHEGAARGLRPTVYGLRRARPKTEIPGVSSVRVRALPGKYLQPASYTLLCAIHAVLRGSYDVVHLHNAEASFVLPLLRLRYPVVATSHGYAYRRAHWGRFARACMQQMDRLFVLLPTIATCVSGSVAAELQSRYGRQVDYVPNGIDIPATDARAAREITARHGLQSREYALFAATKFDSTKGAHIAVAAAAHAAVPLLVIGGAGEDDDSIRRLRSAAGSRVAFQPRIDAPATLFALLDDAACLVFPSALEGMSMLLLECAWLGTPIVCTDIDVNRDVLGGDALYSAPGDPATLAEHLGWVVANRSEAAAMGVRARDTVRRRYSRDAMWSQYAALYDDAIAKSGVVRARRLRSMPS